MFKGKNMCAWPCSLHSICIPKEKAHPLLWNFLRKGTLPCPSHSHSLADCKAQLNFIHCSGSFCSPPGKLRQDRKAENLGNLRMHDSPGWNKNSNTMSNHGKPFSLPDVNLQALKMLTRNPISEERAGTKLVVRLRWPWFHLIRL